MGIFDEIKAKLTGNPDKADEAIERSGDLVDERTDHHYVNQVDTAQEKLREQVHGSQPEADGTAGSEGGTDPATNPLDDDPA